MKRDKGALMDQPTSRWRAAREAGCVFQVLKQLRHLGLRHVEQVGYECGTHTLTRKPRLPGAILINAGTYDDPHVFTGWQMVIFPVDKQPFHNVPERVPVFERVPG
jgi:hypothetical protein